MTLSQLKANDLKTAEFQIVYANTPIPHCLDDTIFVVYPDHVDLASSIHHVSGHLLPSALITCGELQGSKGKMFSSKLTGKPIITIDENEYIDNVIKCCVLNLNRPFAVNDAQGKLTGIITTRTIISGMLHFLESRKLPADINASAIEQTSDLVMIADTELKVQYVNKAYEELTGFKRDEIVAKEFIFFDSGMRNYSFLERLRKRILSGKSYQGVFINRKKDGSLFYEQKTISPIRDESGLITNYVSTAKKISNNVKRKNNVAHLSQRDSLTSLPNRILFMDRLSQSIFQAQRLSSKIAVLFIDLDRFRLLNDRFGLDCGDYIIRETSRRLRKRLRNVDTIARLGGDEFAILLQNINDSTPVASIINDIHNIFASPYSFKEHVLSITTSIGIAIYPTDAGDAQSLLKYAQVAMENAKDAGGNTHEFFSKRMSTTSEIRIEMESSMRKGIDTKGEFYLHYQPQFNILTGEITGTEALARWNHPFYGLLSPVHFIPLAEETGMIEPLSKLIIEEASLQTKKWNESGICNIRTAINISGRLFRNVHFADMFLSILATIEVPLEYIEIEITESTLIGTNDNIKNTLKLLQSRGARIAIDDFGTGYSSFSYLKHLPIDVLKIDKCFMEDITSSAHDALIVNAIVTMAHNLGMATVAEGVETKEQLKFLNECHCDTAQGYYLGRPMGHEDMQQYLRVFGMRQLRANCRQ
jgi:diguanylate cyclase (GGDEF)-like protein/PAS domain S-box-containing protein